MRGKIPTHFEVSTAHVSTHDAVQWRSTHWRSWGPAPLLAAGTRQKLVFLTPTSESSCVGSRMA
jgi:hypothetical protein